MNAYVFGIGNAHVDQELLDLLPVIAVHYYLFLLVVFIFVFFFFMSLSLVLFLALPYESSVGLKVLPGGACTFFQNLSIFL